MPKSTVAARRADAMDAEVGRRVRARRLEQALSQTELAGMVGVTFQQIQKYEKGVNRIGAGRLKRLCGALAVPSSYFMGDGKREPEADSVMFALSQDRGAVRLLGLYKRMKPAKRIAITRMAEELAA